MKCKFIFPRKTMKHIINLSSGEFVQSVLSIKQEAHGPRFAHLIKTATAYLQMSCNILPVLPQQLRHTFDHTVTN